MPSSKPNKNGGSSKQSEPRDVPAPVEFENNAPYSEAARNDSQQPKDYERVVAKWTRVLGLFTVLLFAATALSAYFLWTTDETLRKTFLVSQRPWLSAQVELIGPLQFSPGESRSVVPLKITLKNHGLTLAEDVRTVPVMYPDGLADLPQERNTTRCSAPRNNSAFGDFGFALFPSQEKIELLSPSLPPEEVGRITADVANKKRTFHPAIVVCVTYRAAIDGSRHSTKAFFSIHGRDPERPHFLLPLNIKEAPIPMDRLNILPTGSIAD